MVLRIFLGVSHTRRVQEGNRGRMYGVFGLNPFPKGGKGHVNLVDKDGYTCLR